MQLNAKTIKKCKQTKLRTRTSEFISFMKENCWRPYFYLRQHPMAIGLIMFWDGGSTKMNLMSCFLSTKIWKRLVTVETNAIGFWKVNVRSGQHLKENTQFQKAMQPNFKRQIVYYPSWLHEIFKTKVNRHALKSIWVVFKTQN